MAVGWFMYQAAMGARARADFVARIGGARVGDVMRPVAAAVDGDMLWPRSLPSTVSGRVCRRCRSKWTGESVDSSATARFGSLSDEERSTRTAAEVMTTIGPADVVAAETPLETFFAREAGATRPALVVADGRVVGVVTARSRPSVWLSGHQEIL